MTNTDKIENTKHPIYAISAPSGVGKTTLIHKLVQNHPDKFMLSISHTTRALRGSEVDGVDYHFISEKKFLDIQDSMIEHALVHGNMYGTSKYELDRIESLGLCPLLEIDVQGVAQALKKIPLTTIFVLPPSLQIMWTRLEKRATDDLPTRWKRLQNASKEISQAGNYSYFLINDDLSQAYKKLESFLLDHNSQALLSRKDGLLYCEALQKEFDSSEWIKNLRQQING